MDTDQNTWNQLQDYVLELSEVMKEIDNASKRNEATQLSPSDPTIPKELGEDNQISLLVPVDDALANQKLPK